MSSRPPLPPFTAETAARKARAAADAWNSRDPERVALAYTEDSRWRNRAEFITGRAEIVAFLKRKWARELEYRLIKEVWAFTADRIAVRFAYEWRDDSGSWFPGGVAARAQHGDHPGDRVDLEPCRPRPPAGNGGAAESPTCAAVVTLARGRRNALRARWRCPELADRRSEAGRDCPPTAWP